MTAVHATASPSGFRRSTLPAVADALAVAVAVSLPWSTSATGILIALWLVAVLPALDATALRRELRSAAGGLPVLLVALAAAGLLWSDVSPSDRLRGIEPFLRLLMIPVLFAQFRRSDRGTWVGAAFLVSATILLAVAWTMFIFKLNFGHGPYIPVKDYITQSGIFALCAFALLDIALDEWFGRRRPVAVLSVMLALLFIADIVYVSTSRTTLVVIPVLFVLLGVRRLSWKALAVFLIGGMVLAASVWATSSYVRLRVTGVFTEIAQSQTRGTDTSAGARLAFWKNSLHALQDAPIFGHGTGTLGEMLRRHADPESGAPATNPHNQLFVVGIQLGAIGAALLLAMWAAHWLLFLRPGLAAFVGLIAVTQNIVGSLFNSHLMDFTQAWIYVFAVGVYGGAVLRRQDADAPSAAPPSANR
jgi:O-antigen ligase